MWREVWEMMVTQVSQWCLLPVGRPELRSQPALRTLSAPSSATAIGFCFSAFSRSRLGSHMSRFQQGPALRDPHPLVLGYLAAEPGGPQSG
jgi:hypothetical protein